MLEVQKKYLSYLKEIKNEVNSISISDEIKELFDFEILNKALKDVELIVPVVGAFSAGKSSLINSFLENSLLSVGITPETALATELRYSQDEYIEAVKSDDSFEKYAINDMKIVSDNAEKYKFIRVYLNNINLKEIQPLILVDMPGFDSPLDLHNQAIMEYINKGVHYIILTSVEDGNITRSMVRQISDIQEYGRDFSFFLSKVNLRAASEVEEIIIKVEDQIDEYFDISKKVITVDNNGGESLAKILKEIDPENLFFNLFNKILKNNYYGIIETINTSISAFEKGKKENERAILALKQGLEKLVDKKESMLREAKDKYSDMNANKIIELIGKDISESVDELITSALNGGQDSLSRSISEIVRHSLIKNVRVSMNEIGEKIINDISDNLGDLNSTMSSFTMDDNWLGKITDSAQSLFNSTQSGLNGLVSRRQSKENMDKIYKSITTVLAVTTTVLAPILEVIIIFLPDLLSKFFESIQKKKQEEQIKNTIFTQVIPSLKRGLREKLPSIFQEQVQQIINDISGEFENVLEEKKTTIYAAEKEREVSITDVTKNISEYGAVRDSITNLANITLYI